MVCHASQLRVSSQTTEHMHYSLCHHVQNIVDHVMKLFMAERIYPTHLPVYLTNRLLGVSSLTQNLLAEMEICVKAKAFLGSAMSSISAFILQVGLMAQLSNELGHNVHRDLIVWCSKRQQILDHGFQVSPGFVLECRIMGAVWV